LGHPLPRDARDREGALAGSHGSITQPLFKPRDLAFELEPSLASVLSENQLLDQITRDYRPGAFLD
jgi:hypothetical protein